MVEPPLPIGRQTPPEELGQFAYIISHDFNAPLRTIVEFSRLLKTEKAAALDEEGQQYLSLIINSGEKAQAMLTGLLDYSRLNTMAKPFSYVDTAAVLGDCRLILEEKVKAKKAVINVGQMPMTLMDAEQCMQLFLSLLDNALKFQNGRRPPEITVTAEKREKEWFFTVQDNGIGIDPKFHERIFQLFQRLHTDDEYPGLGMGLTLAKKIVQRHGGRIWVESSAGAGAFFRFTIADNKPVSALELNTSPSGTPSP